MSTDEEQRKIREQEAYLQRRWQESAEYYGQIPVRRPHRQGPKALPSVWIALVVNLVLPGLGFLLISKGITGLLYLVTVLTLALVFWPLAPIFWMVSMIHLSVVFRRNAR